MEFTEEYLKTIKERLNTQDNKATSDPVYLVQEEVTTYGMDSDYSDEYIYYDQVNDIEYSDEDGDGLITIKAMEEGCLRKVYILKDWQYVTLFFTEEGARGFIESQSHRYGPLRVYVDSAYRNSELKLVREILSQGIEL